MGEVISFALQRRIGQMAPPRLLVLSDKVIKPSTLYDAYCYVADRMTGAPAILLRTLRSVEACVGCQLHSPHHLDPLHYLVKSKNIRVVAVVCVMKNPPRPEIGELFPQAQIFFEDVDCLRGLAAVANISL